MSSALVRQVRYRRSLFWTSNPDLWKEIALSAGLCAAGTALGSLGGALAWWMRLSLWGGLLLLAAYVFQRGGLFGPVLFYDLTTRARRGRYSLIRVAFALVLFVLLWQVHFSFESAHWVRMAGGPGPGSLQRIRQLYAAQFFNLFMMVQLFAIVLLTPAYTAGAIAEEKDRRTLEFLLATDLGNREIVLSKLLARFADLVLLILTGLPILSLTELWGGIDPDLLLAGYAATFLTLVSIASLCILVSVHARKARDAIVLSYLAIVAYAGLSGMVYSILKYPALAKTTLPIPGFSLTVQDFVDVVTIGNPLLIPARIDRAMMGGTRTVNQVAFPLLAGYAWFHLPIAMLFTLVAVTRLRIVAMREATRQTARRKSAGKRQRPSWWRPRVGRRPMTWKEICIEPGFAFNWFGKTIFGLIILASFIPAVWIVVDLYLAFRGVALRQGGFSRTFWLQLAGRVNDWVRIVGTLVATLTLVGVAVRAASSVIGEKDRQTWDSLMTTPLESRDMLFGKWLGSVFSVRWVVLWLIVVWCVGVFLGGLYSFAVPWIVLSWIVYATFLATVGLWFSTVCRSSLSAALSTLAATVFCFGGLRLLWWLRSAIVAVSYRGRDSLGWVDQFLLYGLSPRVALGWLSFHGDHLQQGYVGNYNDEPSVILLEIVIGLVFYALAAWGLWTLTKHRFEVASHRVEWTKAAHAAWSRGKKFDVR